MAQKNKLSVGDEPSQINVVEDTSDVKKLNKNPILIVTAVIIILVLALLYATSQRGTKVQDRGVGETTQKTTPIQETSKEEFLADLEKDGGGAMGAIPPAPLASANTSVNVNSDPLADPFAQQNGSIPPSPNGNGAVSSAQSGQVQKRDNPPNMFEEARREQIMNGLKNGMKALDVPSKTGLATIPPSAPGTSAGATPQQAQANAMSGYIDKIMGMGGMGNQIGGVAPDDATKNKNFLKEESSYDYLYSKKTAQRTPFEVKTGTVIPAVLITGVNSELPGKMKAQISENVYDTATGKYLLIPQGSTLVGDYSSNVVYGQSRVLVAWNRIIFPDGHTLNLGNMNGIDREGYSGFQDEVDNHYFRIFGSALVMSAITGGAAVSSNNSGAQMTQTPSDQMIASMIAQLGQVGIQMIQKNLKVAPTIMIRSGYKFNVFVTKDMILEPLKIKLR